MLAMAGLMAGSNRLKFCDETHEYPGCNVG